MLRILRVFVVAFFMALVMAPASAQTTAQRLDRFVTELVQNKQFSGSILVAEEGKTVYSMSAGYAVFSKKVPNTQAISFPIASLSKTMTAIGILQLMEQGSSTV